MKRQRSKWDGVPRKWLFGISSKTETWAVDAVSLASAIRMFRVGCMFPHSCSPGRIQDKDERDGYSEHWLSSKPGSVVQVSAMVEREWKKVTRIPVTDDAAEYDQKALPPNVRTLAETGEISDETALVVAGSKELRPCDIPRNVLAEASVELARKKHELEALVREMNQQVSEIKNELDRRMKQVWLIELFLGSKEEVLVLRQGDPSTEKVAIHQRVLCMDEELAAWRLIHAPEQIEEFCYENLEDFDEWLLADPSHLDQVLPESKGIIALRIRRNPKKRLQFDTANIGDLMVKMREEEADRMTYLLVRNGENLYRLWVDVKLWPRFFPRVTEWDWMCSEDRTLWPSDERQAQNEQQRYAGGLLVLQGLIQRSTLFGPIDSKADVFSQDMEEHFTCLRNDELPAIGDGRVTWKTYRKWLESQLRPGVHVVFRGRNSYHDKLEDRTGILSIMDWPDAREVYDLDAGETRSYGGVRFSFLYMPDDHVLTDWNGNSKTRTKRVRFQCSPDELWPVDFIGWRVVRSLILNRAEREHYAESFPMIARWYRLKKTEQEREQPFVDLALRQADCGEDDRPRAERILRWWKVKTKTHRDLGVDEAKAMRMCVKALRRGDDPPDQPNSPRSDNKPKGSLKQRGRNK